jgi:hypothetical protein
VTQWFIDINYEPLAVAVFAISALFVFNDRFLAVQLTDGVDGAVVSLDTDDRIREFNQQADELFPSLSEGLGGPSNSSPSPTGRGDSDGRYRGGLAPKRSYRSRAWVRQ